MVMPRPGQGSANGWPLLDDGKSYAPTGHALKNWLMGGHAIATSKALFELSLYTGEIIADLFGEDSYFADARQFWQAQEGAIAALAEDYRGRDGPMSLSCPEAKPSIIGSMSIARRRKAAAFTSRSPMAATSRSMGAIAARRKHGAW